MLFRVTMTTRRTYTRVLLSRIGVFSLCSESSVSMSSKQLTCAFEVANTVTSHKPTKDETDCRPADLDEASEA